MNRARLGLWVIIISNALFALTDLRLAPATLLEVYLLKVAQLAVAGAGFWVLGFCRTKARATVVTLIAQGLVCALIAISGVVTVDIVTTCILCLSMAWGAGIILPWGARPQLVAAVLAGTAIIGNVYLARGHLEPLVGYPTVAVTLALGISVYLAYILEQQRIAIAQARDTLDLRVKERTAQLEAANAQLRLTAAALRESQHWLDLALNASNISLWSWNIRTNDLRLSPRWITELGYEEHGIPNTFEEWATHIHPEDRDRLLLSVPTYLQRPSAGYEVEFRLCHKNGSYRWFLSRASLLHDCDGQPERLLGCHIDITDRKRAEELTAALLEVAKDIGGTLDFRALLDRVQQRAADLLPCDAVLTFTVDSEADAGQMLTGYGLPPHLLAAARALRFSNVEPFGGRLRSGETIVINDMQTQSWLSAPLISSFGITALIAVPLQVREHNFGALVACNMTARPFEPHQVELFEGIARQLAVAHEAADLYRLQQQEAEVSGALARAGQEMISSLDAPGVLEKLSHLTTRFMDCDCSFTVLRHESNDTYVVVSSVGFLPDEVDRLRVLKLPPESLVHLHAFLECEETLQIDMAAPPSTWAALPKGVGVERVLYVPIRRGARIIGIHAAGYREPGRLFNHQHKRILHGIGHLASTALENARLLAELEKANHLKSDFAATMSHELRTPLNIILGYNELILAGEFGPLTAKQTDPLQRMKASGRQLMELITATLDLSRLDTGQLPLELRTIRVSELFRETEVEINEAHGRPGVTCEWYVSPDLRELQTDPAKLKIVLKNLVGNALKFTDRGSVRVDAYRRQDGVEFRVSDTGVGIAPEALPIIFEAFRQVDSSMTRRHGGVGLGLYIVRRLLDLLGGTIAVESEVGRGSTFRVWIPRLTGPESGTRATPAQAA